MPGVCFEDPVSGAGLPDYYQFQMLRGLGTLARGDGFMHVFSTIPFQFEVCAFVAANRCFPGRSFVTLG